MHTIGNACPITNPHPFSNNDFVELIAFPMPDRRLQIKFMLVVVSVTHVSKHDIITDCYSIPTGYVSMSSNMNIIADD